MKHSILTPQRSSMLVMAITTEPGAALAADPNSVYAH